VASLIVNNVIESSVQVSYSYLDSDELFGYEVIGTYQIDISDINFEQNDTVLQQGRDAIESAYARPNIVARIGADEYLKGRIQSFDFAEGSLVGSETVSIVIQESRRLDDYSTDKFARLAPNPHLIESFEESYNFSRNGSDYSSDRKVSLTYKQDAGSQFFDDARTFLTNFYFLCRPSLGYQEDGISENAKIDKGFRGEITEEYDLIGLSVSLTEKLNSSYVDQAKHISRRETQSISIGEDGFKEKVISMDLTSLRRDSENVLNSAIIDLVDEFKAKEQGEFGTPFSIEKGLKQDGQSATLTLSYSTDPKKSGENIISYSGSESKNGRFTEYSLSISYKSEGKDNRQKFTNTKASWVASQTSNPIRIQRLFHPLEDIVEKSRSTNFRKSEGAISENIVFTTDLSYKDSQDGLLKFKKTLKKTHQIDRIYKFLDLMSLEDQVVANDKKTLGQATVTAEAIASQSMGIYHVKNVIESDAKTTEMNELVDEDVIHIIDDTVNLNLGQGSASRSIQYLFFKE
tara:strand:+ start:9531 stop:11084 length:1554 start_codon:yes stop_codon:yes gene_type:complete